MLTPMGAYPLLRHPDWALMYLTDPAQLAPLARWALVAALPVTTVLGAWLAAFLLGRRAITPALVLVSLSAALAVGLLVWGSDRAWRIGAFVDYHSDGRAAMPVLGRSRLGLALLFMVPALLTAWGVTLHTLRRRRHVFEVFAGS